METPPWLGWLRLSCTPALGNLRAQRLLQALGSPEAIFAAGPSIWRDLAGPAVSAGLATIPAELAEAQARCEAWLAQDPAHRHLLTQDDARYPALLREIADPPLLLFALGNPDWLSKPMVAIVGSRQCTPGGRQNAKEFASALSQQHITVVSGLALGIDGSAHEGALAGPGSTVAVVGTGLDIVYPSRHRDLAHRIAEQGLMLSEFLPGTPSMPANFPRRNRLIAGMSLGTLVVEADLQSGSLITARLALEANRDVFAIPGSIHAPQSRGCHHLIKQGAKLVDSVDDVVQELGWAATNVATAPPSGEAPLRPSTTKSSRRPSPAAPPALTSTASPALSLPPDAPEHALLAAMGFDPISLDAVCERTGWPVDRLQVELLTLELSGLVMRLPGGLLQRCAQA